MKLATFVLIGLSILMAGCEEAPNNDQEAVFNYQKHDCVDSRKGVALDIYRVFTTKDVAFLTTKLNRDENGCLYGTIGIDENVRHCGPVYHVSRTGMFYCDLSGTIAPAGWDASPSDL